MALTLAHLQGEGWDVEDVHLRESFDYTARRNGVELHVEVKGLVGSLQEVLITVNERSHAECWPDVALAIATNIKVDRSGDEVLAQGGDLEVIRPWRIENGELEACIGSSLERPTIALPAARHARPAGASARPPLVGDGA